MTVTIHTPRLRIDALLAADAPALYAYRAHPSVTRFQSWQPASVAEAEAFIARQDAATFDRAGSWYQLAVRMAGSGELVGDLGLHFVDERVQQVEIGFTIAPAHQRQGLGAEAVGALIGHLFDALGKHRVHASVDPRNEASTTLLRRIGMRQEAHFRESLWWRGEWVDDVVFAILRSEWPLRPQIAMDTGS